MLDALATGVPVLASDRGGLPELRRARRSRPKTRPPGPTRSRACGATPASARGWAPWSWSEARERLGEDRYYRGLMDAYAPAG